MFAAGVVAVGLATGFDFYTSARQKVDLIESGHLQPGARVDLSLGELNAFASKEAPAGVRIPKLVLEGQETVSGSAMVDFGKLRRAQGYEPGWLMSKLLDGERPVSATARIHSGAGDSRGRRARLDIGRRDRRQDARFPHSELYPAGSILKPWSAVRWRWVTASTACNWRRREWAC